MRDGLQSFTKVGLACCMSWASLRAMRPKAKTPTLDEILQRLDVNLSHYDAHVPSLFCNEHVLSLVKPGPRNQDTVTDSVFRLKRSLNTDRTTSLDESRDIKTGDGKTPTSQDLDGPSLLSGVFEGGLTVVSQSQAACMNYSLQKVKKHRPAEPYIIRFATGLTPANSARCLLQENSSGRALIDRRPCKSNAWNSPLRIMSSSPAMYTANGILLWTMHLSCLGARPSGCLPSFRCASPAVPEPSTSPSGHSKLPIATTTSRKSHRTSFQCHVERPQIFSNRVSARSLSNTLLVTCAKQSAIRNRLTSRACTRRLGQSAPTALT